MVLGKKDEMGTVLFFGIKTRIKAKKMENMTMRKSNLSAAKPLCPLLGAEITVRKMLELAARSLHESVGGDAKAPMVKMAKEVCETTDSQGALRAVLRYVTPVTQKEYEKKRAGITPKF
jgi:hypothetical protein